jgi:peptide deformylase
MIITNNEKALRVKCAPVLSDEIGALVGALERELQHSASLGRVGIGLAAPQIGIAKNIAIVRINDQYKVNLVNCKIKKKYDQFIFKEEGCLSFPNRIENTLRYQEIYVEDNDAYPHSFIATGLMAVVIQHELDHLNSILLPDIALPKPSTLKGKIPPNDPCFCGKININTGKIMKYKKCCGQR